MRTFNVKVNNKNYTVEVEEINNNDNNSSPTPQNTPTIQNKPQNSKQQTVTDSSSTPINAPMPGNIIDIKVSINQTVKKDQPIIILESMKMENEIVSPCDGVISAINFKKGDNVNIGDTLILIK